MVEIKLQTVDFEHFTNDHYISVRVGEAQKLAKLANSRTFKLSSSAIGNRKFGKVELFKRVGSCPVCVDPASAGGVNELEVSFDDTCLHLNAEVSSADGRSKGVSKAGTKGESEEQRRATEYIQEHNLELRLAEAMQQVLRERPADPAQFIADALTKRKVFALKAPKKPAELAKAPRTQFSLASIPEAAEPSPVVQEPPASEAEAPCRSSPRKPLVTCVMDDEALLQPENELGELPISPEIGRLMRKPRALLSQHCCKEPAGSEQKSGTSSDMVSASAEPARCEGLPCSRRLLPSMGSYHAPSSYGGLLTQASCVDASSVTEQRAQQEASSPPGAGPIKRSNPYSKFTSAKAAALQHDDLC